MRLSTQWGAIAGLVAQRRAVRSGFEPLRRIHKVLVHLSHVHVRQLHHRSVVFIKRLLHELPCLTHRDHLLEIREEGRQQRLVILSMQLRVGATRR